jgi:RNA polymerase sigma factor (sigma-70 family)
MEEAYFKAETYEDDESLGSKAGRGRTLSWLRTIARRIFLQELRVKKKLPQSLSLDTDNSQEVVTDIIKKLSSNGIVDKSNLNKINIEIENSFLRIEDNRNYISTERKILREVISSLPEREREILLMYVAEFDPRIKNQKLPRAKIKELSEKYDITPAYIRKIKERTFKAVYKECKAKEAIIKELNI